jgi:hypothetical protein
LRIAGGPSGAQGGAALAVMSESSPPRHRTVRQDGPFTNTPYRRKTGRESGAALSCVERSFVNGPLVNSQCWFSSKLRSRGPLAHELADLIDRLLAFGENRRGPGATREASRPRSAGWRRRLLPSLYQPDGSSRRVTSELPTRMNNGGRSLR